ncbi:hypothetical protein AF332_11475 [Sporosarcina globispora]|uniref:Uncharacterized protein n=1 Tax=Sporosarcina globispora TaxID=1459 RepID=A0A0M0GC06_SPOGL|nr:hypothetical protein [Sporosarcina globispora]KON87384.1 hypothetical protein AF332_11475 [Sporosarcina globispora]
MITSGMLEELLENIDKPKQPDLIVEQKKNKYIAYFRKSPQRIGFGNSEVKALENLKSLLG